MAEHSDKDIKQVYDNIAESFYNMRQRNPHPVGPHIRQLSKEWKPGLLLDVGCGIGTWMIPFIKNGFECIGIDISPKVIEFAKKYAKKHKTELKLKTANMLELPFDDDKFDYVISVAAIHHLDSRKKRVKALSEMKRVLKPDGKMFIAVWNKEQQRFSGSKKDIYVPWKHEGKMHERYYHLFSNDELKGIVEKSGIKIEKIFVDNTGKNICLICKK
ncbi:MAG: methyltransferase domain-containing protein [Candidatus Aenigmatarchaeota archaeon]